MITSFLGIKHSQTQAFLQDGTRVPVTHIVTEALPVVSVKTLEKQGYNALELGFGIKKNANKATLGHIKGANLKKAPAFFREVRLSKEQAEEMPKAGDMVSASDVFKEGDIVNVTSVSKGKGFAGVVKRHGFKGGPRTHGQSDRERAPGSIGQTTTPGRVYKGKRMAGRMGHENVTIKNIKVVGVAPERISLSGLVPGGKNTLVMIKKVGEDKKFVPLYKEAVEEEIKEPEAVQKEEKIEAAPEEKAQIVEEKKEEKENAS